MKRYKAHGATMDEIGNENEVIYPERSREIQWVKHEPWMEEAKKLWDALLKPTPAVLLPMLEEPGSTQPTICFQCKNCLPMVREMGPSKWLAQHISSISMDEYPEIVLTNGERFRVLEGEPYCLPIKTEIINFVTGKEKYQAYNCGKCDSKNTGFCPDFKPKF
jgi:hypothetical protein